MPSASRKERTSGLQHSVCRSPGSGQAQCTPMEKICSHFHLDPKTLQSERADKRDGGESAAGCGHRAKIDKAQTVLNRHTTSGKGFCPWSPPRGGARDQSSLRAGACRPREKRARSITGRALAFDLDHALPNAPELCCALPSHQKLRKLTKGSP